MTDDNMTLSSQIKQAADPAEFVKMLTIAWRNTDTDQKNMAIHAAAMLIPHLIASHEARERELVEALEPFAELDLLQWHRRKETITVGDLRRAAKAVKGEG